MSEMRDTIAESLNKITEGLSGITPTSQADGRVESKRRPKRAIPVDQAVRTGSVLLLDDTVHPALLVWTRRSGEGWAEAWKMDDGEGRDNVQVMIQGMGYFARASVRKAGDRLVIDSLD